MPHSYSDVPRPIKYEPLGDEALIAIGRIIRAFAEYEEIITLYIAGMVKLNVSQVVVMLGKTGITARLNMAQQLAETTPGEYATRLKEVFESPFFSSAQICRNAVAHGIYLGVDDEGWLSFLTDRKDRPTDISIVHVAASYSAQTLKDCADGLERNLPIAAERLGIAASLRKYQKLTLDPHSKAQPRRNRDGTPKPPPQASRA